MLYKQIAKNIKLCPPIEWVVHGAVQIKYMKAVVMRFGASSFPTVIRRVMSMGLVAG